MVSKQRGMALESGVGAGSQRAGVQPTLQGWRHDRSSSAVGRSGEGTHRCAHRYAQRAQKSRRRGELHADSLRKAGTGHRRPGLRGSCSVFLQLPRTPASAFALRSHPHQPPFPLLVGAMLPSTENCLCQLLQLAAMIFLLLTPSLLFLFQIWFKLSFTWEFFPAAPAEVGYSVRDSHSTMVPSPL